MEHARTATDRYRTTANGAGLRLVLGPRRGTGADGPNGPNDANGANSAHGAHSANAADRWLLGAVQAGLNQAPVQVRLWDETTMGPADAVATVRIHDRGALLALVRHPDLAFGDGYAAGRIDVEGPMVGLLEALFRAKPGTPVSWRHWSWHEWVRRLVASPNALGRARKNIHHHYDIGNDFYALWLDREMVYTCAYFPTADASLDAAQIAKMEHVCRKLRLRPGERVIEAGCGWGALARYMASRHGVRVRAFNISREQIAYARARARDEGLADRVEFIEDDYRNIGRAPEDRADAFVSVGMLEHVGLAYFPALAEVIDRVLAPDRGRGLLHFIGRNAPQPLHPWIERRIFPGAYPPTLAQAADGVFRPAGLTILDVENLRLHYARTLEHWLARYEEAVPRIIDMFDEPFSRAWRVYLAGSAASFTTGCLQLFQVTFARERDNDLPWTREHLYGHL